MCAPASCQRGGRLDAATFDAASGLLEDPDYWTQCWMMTAVWARKPDERG
jgi:hypothetical protein